MIKRWKLMPAGLVAAGIIGLAVGPAWLRGTAIAQQPMVEVPLFEVDPLWPKPIPNAP